eukprot:gene27768-7408_t
MEGPAKVWSSPCLTHLLDCVQRPRTLSPQQPAWASGSFDANLILCAAPTDPAPPSQHGRRSDIYHPCHPREAAELLGGAQALGQQETELEASVQPLTAARDLHGKQEGRLLNQLAGEGLR